MRKYGILLALAVAALFAACGAGRQPAAPPEPPLVFDRNQVWQLVSLRGKTLPSSPKPVTLVFNPEAGALNGHTGCNRYFADFTLRQLSSSKEGTRYDLKIVYLSADKTRCPETDMEAEERYLALLSKADACLLTAYRLTLYRGSKEIMHFELQ